MIPEIEKFKEIVHSVEIFEFIQEEGIARLKIKLVLKDSSYIYAREVKSKNSNLYSYYWLREDNSIIMGWDNAPHHRELDNFPFHKHINNQVEPSIKMDLGSVLKIIKELTISEDKPL